jgi:hypothetical protein
MAAPPPEGSPRSPGPRSPGQHIELVDDNPSPRLEGEASPGIKNSKGWDGKLRITKTAVLANPEALSDPEYSDSENVDPGEEIPADEGTRTLVPALSSAFAHINPASRTPRLRRPRHRRDQLRPFENPVDPRPPPRAFPASHAPPPPAKSNPAHRGSFCACRDADRP